MALFTERERYDKWCEVTVPLPHCFFVKHRDISESDEFFNLLHEVENDSCDKDDFHVEAYQVLFRWRNITRMVSGDSKRRWRTNNR